MPARNAKVVKVCQFLVSLIGLAIPIEYSLLLRDALARESARGTRRSLVQNFGGRGAADEVVRASLCRQMKRTLQNPLESGLRDLKTRKAPHARTRAASTLVTKDRRSHRFTERLSGGGELTGGLDTTSLQLSTFSPVSTTLSVVRRIEGSNPSPSAFSLVLAGLRAAGARSWASAGVHGSPLIGCSLRLA